MVREWTDPLIADQPAAEGYVDVNKAEHVLEIRREIEKLSLFNPHLDERPVRCQTKEYQAVSANTDYEIMAETGSGCIRTIHFVTNEGVEDTARIKIYIDGEVSARVDVTMREWGFAGLAAPPYYSDYQGFTGMGSYRHQPIPFHTSVRVVYRNSVSTTYLWSDITYNYSATKDFNYGRYKYFNWITDSDLPVAGQAWHTFANISGKVGAIFATYHEIDHTVDPTKTGGFWEGNYEIYTDTVLAVRGTGSEDYYLSSYGWTKFGFAAGEGVGYVNLPSGGVLTSRSVGMTQLNDTVDGGGVATRSYWAGYRYFDVSHLIFDDSFQVKWRNGDAGAEAWRGDPGPTDSYGHVLYYTST